MAETSITAKRGKGSEPKPNGARKGAGAKNSMILEGLLARVCLGTRASAESCPDGDCVTSYYEMSGKLRATITMKGSPAAIARAARESCVVGIFSLTHVARKTGVPEHMALMVSLSDDPNPPFDYKVDIVENMKVTRGSGYVNRFGLPGMRDTYHVVLMRSPRKMERDRATEKARLAGTQNKLAA